MNEEAPKVARLRVLGSVRLSRLTDASTSPARQRERIDWWSSGNDSDVIHVTEDLDVSGAVSPFDRPELGEWLTDERAGMWDVLVAWKLDRISRSAEDTLKLLNWCLAHDKRIVCVDDGIDTVTQMGQVWIQLAAIFAQVERTAISERALSSRHKLRSEGRWHGEAVMYGYREIKLPGGGWRLEIDPYSAEVLRRIVRQYLSGDSAGAIAEQLTAERVLTPREYRRSLRGGEAKFKSWHGQTILKILSSKTLLGHVTEDGVTYYDGDGVPILKAEPILTQHEYDQVQERVRQRSRAKVNNRTRSASPLLGVAFCFDCGGRLHHRGQTEGGKLYRYYPCSQNCGARPPRADDLETVTEEEFLEQLGDKPVREPVLIPAEDHTAELDEAVRALDELTAMAGRAQSQTARERLRGQLTALDDRMRRLEALPRHDARIELRPTGRTYREEWTSRNEDGRRRLLQDAGIVVRAKRGEFALDVDLNRVTSLTSGERSNAVSAS